MSSSLRGRGERDKRRTRSHPRFDETVDINEIPPEPLRTEQYGDWMTWMVRRAHLDDSTPVDSNFNNTIQKMIFRLMAEQTDEDDHVEVCCAEGRDETPQTISEHLADCEKSLNECLAQKKKACSRRTSSVAMS